MIALPCDGHNADSVRALGDEAFDHLYWSTHAEVIKHPLSVVAQVPQFLIDENTRRQGLLQIERMRLEIARLWDVVHRQARDCDRLRARIRALGVEA